MNSKLTLDQVNYLNIFLMLLSAVLAFARPFELFLLVYAFLGPLHYLTEISWLHDRNYYTQRKNDYFFLLSASVAVTIFSLGQFQGAPEKSATIIIYAAFGAALVFLLQRDLFKRMMFFLVLGFAGLLLMNFSIFNFLFGMLVPTLVHVFVFTGLFILGGALKNKSLSGFLSLAVFVGAAAALFLFHSSSVVGPSGYVRNSYGFFNGKGEASIGFISLNFQTMKAFGLHDFGSPTLPLADYLAGINDFLYRNPSALSLMAFIAFSYTYHYLNWFSKTSIIRWHEVSRGRMTSVAVIWVASIILYAWNYSLGFRWLFFLSFAHVLLEFPLNHLSVINIGREMGRLAGYKKGGLEAE